MKPTKRNIIQRLNDAGLKPPRAVTMAVTNQCNLRCRHCWPESGPDEHATMVPKREVLRLMTGFSVLGAEELVITGGEPLTRPDWFDLLAYACEKLGFGQIRLQTNAILLTPEHVALLRGLADQGLMVQISLEGAAAENHDSVRGVGSFRETMRGLNLLVNGGLAHRICVTFTEMAHNFDDIPQLLELVDEMGIHQFVTGTLVCGGRAAQAKDLAPPTPGQYENLLARYQVDPAFRERYRRIGNIAALEWGSSGAKETDPCCTLIETPYVSAEGRLYPCVMLHADIFAAADVYKRPLPTAISEKIESWSGLQQLNHARPDLMDACRDCPAYESCRTGCMGRAYTAYGDFFAVEDRCQLRLAVHHKPSTTQ